MAYYVICKSVTNLDEMEEMEGSLFLPAFQKLKFVNVNNPIFKRLLHFSFSSASRRCQKWNDYKMHVAPYQKGKRYDEYEPWYGITLVPPDSLKAFIDLTADKTDFQLNE